MATGWRGRHRGVPRLPPGRPSDAGRHPARGRHAALPAPRLSERVGAEVLLKIEGANPTGSFKDRGMTMAISKAVEEGAKAVVCASTGNTSASAAAYAARAGLTCAVLIPEGHIALGKLAQALVHGARVLQVRGNFDEALDHRARPARHAPGHRGQLGQPLPDRRPEDRRVRDRRRAGRRARRPLHPGRQRRQHHRLLAGLLRVPGGRARRPSCPGCSASRPPAPRRSCSGHPVENPETIATAIRIGNPASWYAATAAASRVGRCDHRRDRRGDPRRPTASWPSEESVFCEAASAASVAGLLEDRRPARARPSSASSPATG